MKRIISAIVVGAMLVPFALTANAAENYAEPSASAVVSETSGGEVIGSNYNYEETDGFGFSTSGYYSDGVSIQSASLDSYSGDKKDIVIPEYAAEDCPVTRIFQAAFAGCKDINSITIPKTVKNIDDHAFIEMSGLKEIKVSSENEYFTVVDGALYSKDMTKLVAVPSVVSGEFTLPDTVTEISTTAFDNSAATSIKAGSKNTAFTSVDGALYSKDKTTLYAFPKSKTGEYSIPEGVTTVNTDAFANCKLSKLNIPKSVTEISYIAGKYGYYLAFYGCDSLTEINVDKDNEVFYSVDGVLFMKKEKVGYDYETETTEYEDTKTLYVFPKGKSGEYSVPEETEEIYGLSFAFAKKITKLNIPASVEVIGYGVTRGCTSLKAFNVDKNNKVYSSADGVLFQKEYRAYGYEEERILKNVLLRFPLGKSGDYVIPDGTQAIGTEAFCYNSNIKSITIPESVEEFLMGSFDSWISYNHDLTIIVKSKEIQFYIPYTSRNLKIYAPEGSPLFDMYSPSDEMSEEDKVYYPTVLPLSDYKPTAYLMGDVDLDGSITSNDALNILRAVVGLENFDSTQEKLADVNGNGSTDSGDSLSILRYVVGYRDNDVNIGK